MRNFSGDLRVGEAVGEEALNRHRAGLMLGLADLGMKRGYFGGLAGELLHVLRNLFMLHSSLKGLVMNQSYSDGSAEMMIEIL